MAKTKEASQSDGEAPMGGGSPPATTPGAICVPFALRLHGFGLERLLDPNWTGMMLYDHLKAYMRGRAKPEGVLFKTLETGVLTLMGGWFYDEFLDPDHLREGLACEHRLWHVDDVTTLLESSGINSPHVNAARVVVDELDALFVDDEQAYFEALCCEQDDTSAMALIDAYEAMIESCAPRLQEQRDTYAVDFADRVFHDRQWCEFISELIFAIGIDGGLGEDEPPRRWVDRQTIPQWAKQAVIARDRGCCTLCAAAITTELAGNPHIDHIVPLAHGGTNDILNLQLLCAACNLKKSANRVPVKSSVPPYMRRHRSR